ncbi:MAG: M28 family peptidase [Chitinophagaceae bacterium]|nr:MAG: M28 family peptidase [Chitinophagaceae bacterium]
MKSLTLFLIAILTGLASYAQMADSVQLMKDVNSLTSGESGELGNRFVGTRSSRKAQFYITGRFGAMGLQQFYNTYSQPFFFYYKYKKIMGTNLLGYIKGKTNSWIIISAHYDNLKGAPAYAGTDTVSVRHGDNVSGVAAMLAMISWFKRHQPRHNLLFVAFDGEQEGLMGSKAFVQTSKDLLKEARLNINIDQIGSSGNNTLFACGTHQYPGLKSLIAQADSNQNISVAFGHDDPEARDNWINQGDQGSFNAAHIPFICFGTDENNDPAGSEQVNPRFFYPAVQVILKATINLDKYMDVHLPSRNKWIMQEKGDSNVSR